MYPLSKRCRYVELDDICHDQSPFCRLLPPHAISVLQNLSLLEDALARCQQYDVHRDGGSRDPHLEVNPLIFSSSAIIATRRCPDQRWREVRLVERQRVKPGQYGLHFRFRTTGRGSGEFILVVSEQENYAIEGLDLLFHLL